MNEMDERMEFQMDLFTARRRRDAGIARVSAKNATFLETMRGVARMICRQKGYVTADDLREWVSQHPEIGEPSHYNVYGAVFHRSEFVPGEFVVSKQVRGHGNRIRVHRLKEST